MKKEFVPYEIALELKELGFDRPCFLKIQYSSGIDIFTGSKFKNSIWLGNGYDAQIDGKKLKYEYPINSDQKYGELKIPTFSQVFKWFREDHFLHSHITCSCTVNEILSYDWTIHKIMNPGTREENFIKDYERTYEEAELECLKKLIEIVKNR